MVDDLELSDFRVFEGPNAYLDRQALAFRLYLEPRGHEASFYHPEVVTQLPALAGPCPDRVAELFARTVIEVLKVELDLCLRRYAVEPDGSDWFQVAVEYLDTAVAKDAVHVVRDWFRAMDAGREYPLAAERKRLQDRFNRTLLGGPTLYSLIEAGLRREIPIFFLRAENQFQWGYGRKQVRGRSTIVHTDGIKDTEFTTYKDMCKDFLLECGFPTPRGSTCYSVEDAVKAAEELGYPCVVKPVAGHKGQGVVTGICDAEGVKHAYAPLAKAHEETGASWDGVIVEQQVTGTDHRLLAVGGKFVAGLQRVPAYVDGDGTSTIATLIERENATVARLDTPRSALCKIKVDADLLEYLGLQNLTVDSVPAAGTRVVLRRVANISQGGVSINVTDRVHPLNVKMVDDIAKYFRVTCLGIDVLCEDISKPWTEGGLGIIEINAGPGVFMHLVPALGEPVPVPDKIMRVHFPTDGCDRVPIVCGNRLTASFVDSLQARLKALRPGLEVGSVTSEGVRFDGAFLCRNREHDLNVRVVLRSPRLDFAVFNHTEGDIADWGLMHQGADVVILEDPRGDEKVLERDLLPGGWLLDVGRSSISVVKGGKVTAAVEIGSGEGREAAVLRALEPLLPELLARYDAVPR